MLVVCLINEKVS